MSAAGASVAKAVPKPAPGVPGERRPRKLVAPHSAWPASPTRTTPAVLCLRPFHRSKLLVLGPLLLVLLAFDSAFAVAGRSSPEAARSRSFVSHPAAAMSAGKPLADEGLEAVARALDAVTSHATFRHGSDPKETLHVPSDQESSRR